MEVKLQRWEAGAVAALLALALVVRIVGLNASLWYDEVSTLTHFVRLPWGELATDFSSLNNHMFYSLQAKAAVELFGESAWALRLPALLMGMASLEGGPAQAARDFAALRELRDRLQTTAPPNVSLSELSMGMSGDFAEAITAGAKTCCKTRRFCFVDLWSVPGSNR